MYFPILDHQSQVLHFSLVKGTLCQLQVEIFLLHPFEYPLGSFLTLFLGFGKYKDVIHVDDKPSFHDHLSKDRVHEGLEGWWGVTLSEEHDQEFVKTVGGDECGFLLVSFFDVNVVIPPLYIHLGEVFGSF